MIYKSNLVAPDLTRFFPHLHMRPMSHSFGHSVPSDWADKSDDDPVFGIFKRCGLWTVDELGILTAVAKQSLGKPWLDIGAHTGWTGKHINWMTNQRVFCVDPMFISREFMGRFVANSGFPPSWTFPGRSREFFKSLPDIVKYGGVCVDGSHFPGDPLEDAQNASKHLAEAGVIIFHDAIGKPVREAALWLMDHGFRCRTYFTPHMVMLCWRGDSFVPPDHEPDVDLVAQLQPHLEQMTDFDFGRCV